MTVEIIYDNKDISGFVKDVKWSGSSGKFNRQLDVSFMMSNNLRKVDLRIVEGRSITFKYGKKTLFHGIVFSVDTDSDGSMSITCYDPNIYLTKSNDIRKFENMKASDIVRRLARDSGISVESIDDTGYVIPLLILRNKSLYEMILTALTLTRKQTGKRFFVMNEGGKLTLRATENNPDRYVIKAGTNLMSASYSRTIEETKTQVKVTGGDKKKPFTHVVKNDGLRKKYGVMQHVEEMDEKATSSQVKQQATTLLKELSVVDDQANIEALGVAEVVTGTPVYVVEPMTGLSGGYYVTDDSHTFKDGLHTMSLEITRTYDLPPIEISAEVLGEDEQAKR